MNHFDEWKTLGPVRTLRTELAEWDLTREQWQAPTRLTVTQFRTDGAISELEDHSPGRSVSKSRFIYDEAGRLLEVQFRLNDGPLSITNHHYDDLGRLVRKTILQGDGTEVASEVWNYDQKGRKTKVQLVPKIDSGICGMMFGIEGTQLGYGAEDVVEIMTLYDDGDQPSEALFYEANRHLALRVVFTRDTAGRLISEEGQRGDKLPPSLEKYIAGASADD